MTVLYRQSDPCTDMILDFIAGGVPSNPRGESCGNYNAVIGNASATLDLSALTLAEIYTKQAALARRNPSGAIGRYQFINRTLRRVVGMLLISETDHFTPALQDRLALELLRGRGYGQWWRGTLSDRAFAHNLSLEWASLPDPERDGLSHYQDDEAGNSASTTLDAVYAMLQSARAVQPTQSAALPTATPPAPPPPAPGFFARIRHLIFGTV